MSRIGKLPIKIPEGVTVEINDDRVLITGKKGRLSQALPENIKVKRINDELIVERLNETKFVKSMHGTIRQLINNAIIGVSSGFERALIVEGLGYRVSTKEGDLYLEVGFSHPVRFRPPEGIRITVEGKKIKVSGTDKQVVGEVAAKIKRIRPARVYDLQGIRFEDELIRRKTAKAKAT